MEHSKTGLAEMRHIGLRIAYFRKLRDLTQTELAEKVGINKNYLSHIESGSANKVASLPLLIRIAQILGVPLSVLVDLSDADTSMTEMRSQFEEMHALFQEMKQMNAELDQMLADFDEMDFDEK